MSSSRLSKTAFDLGYSGKGDFDKWLKQRVKDEDLHSSLVRELRREYSRGQSERISQDKFKAEAAYLKAHKRDEKAPPIPEGEKASDQSQEYKGHLIKRTTTGWDVLGESGWGSLSDAKQYVDLYVMTGGKVKRKNACKPSAKARFKAARKTAEKRVTAAAKALQGNPLKQLHSDPLNSNAGVNRREAARLLTAGVSPREIAEHWPMIWRLSADGKIGQKYDSEFAGTGLYETKYTMSGVQEFLKEWKERKKAKALNPEAVRTSKYKGSMMEGPHGSTRQQLMARRRTKAQVGTVTGTDKNKRYMVWAEGQILDRPYAASMVSAKKKGIALARKFGKSKFEIQNQVTGSILSFEVQGKRNPGSASTVSYKKHFLTGNLKGLTVDGSFDIPYAVNDPEVTNYMATLRQHTKAHPGKDAGTRDEFWVSDIRVSHKSGPTRTWNAGKRSIRKTKKEARKRLGLKNPNSFFIVRDRHGRPVYFSGPDRHGKPMFSAREESAMLYDSRQQAEAQVELLKRFGVKGSRISNPSGIENPTATLKQGDSVAYVVEMDTNSYSAQVMKKGGDRESRDFKGRGAFNAAMSWARLRLHEVANPCSYRLFKEKPKGRRNPEDASVRMYEKFHGIPSEEVREYIEEEHRHSWLAGLGPLISMVVMNVQGNKDVLLEFPDPLDNDATEVVMLCVTEDGNQLVCTGGDQELPEKFLIDKFGMTPADFNRDNALIGTIKQITYRTKKKFEKDGTEEIDFFHDLGGEGSRGVYPVLEYKTRSPRCVIVGGRYYVGKYESSIGASPGVIG